MSNEKTLPWGLKPKSISSGSMKTLSDNKLKAFNIGVMNTSKSLSRKELDELKKKKQEQETEEVYKEFVETFENTNKGITRAWVKGGLAGEKGEKKESSSGKLYKPVSKLLEKKGLQVETPSLKKEEKHEKPPSLKKKGLLSTERKKTNLELFKEELKVIQEERSERRKVRKDLGLVQDDSIPSLFSKNKSHLLTLDNEPIAAGVSMGILPIEEEFGLPGMFNYESDTQTTNIYLGNLNPKMTEVQICELFGQYGPLASVKVMWPRTEEEKSRGRNCGFVAFMNRKDGERALNNLQGKEVMDFEMKLGWGKCVVIPPHPIYIPPALSELTLPPPPSGLPFNAQNVNDSMDLDQCLVKVVIPTEKTLMCVIHRTIEFVVREGPMFEAMIMNRELHNPLFRFLFENKTPAHIYYRWKLYSILQGDSPYSWKTDEFRMFESGSVWRPPPKNPFSQGMPEELINNSKPAISLFKESKKPLLSDSQRERFEDMLRGITPERLSVGDCMVWCMKHAEYAEEIVDCITEAICQKEIPAPTRIARLFLISDLLHNSSARIPNASYFRRYFESHLAEIFKNMREAHGKIDARLKAEQFKQKVMACFRAWEDWTVYSNDHLIHLQNIFLGLVLPKELEETNEEEAENEDDVDGIPLDELDGVPMDNCSKDNPVSIVPYTNDSDNETVPESAAPKPTFVPSKWEEVDENDLESQAMTVSKWDTLNQKKEFSIVDYDDEDEDIDGVPLEESSSSNSKLDIDKLSQKFEKNESKREKLKEIETMVLQYQDELEKGKGSVDKKWIADKVNELRQKLLKKEFSFESSEKHSSKSSRKSEKKKKDSDNKRRSPRSRDRSSNDDSDHSNERKHKKRSYSRSPRRRRSRSPRHKSSKKSRR